MLFLLAAPGAGSETVEAGNRHMSTAQSFETYFHRIENAIKKDNQDELSDALIALSISDGVRGENQYPEVVLKRLFEYLTLFQGSSQKGGESIFQQIIASVPQLSSEQLRQVCDHLNLNYGKYIEPNLSWAIAEWVGGCRNSWALDFMEKWTSDQTPLTALEGLAAAFDEFVGDVNISYAYSADDALLKRAHELSKKFRLILENKKKRSLQTK